MSIIDMGPIRVRLAELRKVRGWSQAQLADRAGVRQATVSNIESGKVKRLDLEILDRLARALEVDPGYLIVRSRQTDEDSR